MKKVILVEYDTHFVIKEFAGGEKLVELSKENYLANEVLDRYRETFEFKGILDLRGIK
ncbi:MAG: hypothetical protein R3Y05_01490 [bacterium]